MYISRKRRLLPEAQQKTTKRTRPRRFHLAALRAKAWAFLHDDSRCLKAELVDISRSGMFVKTDSLPFAPGTELKVTVKLPSHATHFQQRCEVVRSNTNGNEGIGYGLRFSETSMEVLELVGKMGRQNCYGEYFLLTPEQRSSTFLMMDHDRVFGQIMSQSATQIGVHLEAINQFQKIRRLKLLDQYDFLVVNYDLEPYSGLEIAEQLAELLPGKPLVMMTEGRTGWEQKREFQNIVATISKWESKRNFFTRLLHCV